MGVRAYTWRTESGATSEPVEIAPDPALTNQDIIDCVKNTIEAFKCQTKLYLLEKRPGAAGWLRYDMVVGFLIRATSERKARELAADSCEDKGPWGWMDEKLTSCTQIEEMGPVAVLMKSMVNG